MTQERSYPYTAWKLQPSFKPIQVEIVGLKWNSDWPNFDKTDKGAVVSIYELFPTREEAIAFGLSRVAEQQAAIDKKQANLNKRRAALQKASND